MTGAERRAARIARLGPEATAAAEHCATSAPPPSPELRRAIEALLRQYGVRADGGAADAPTEVAS
jgi:hypothetical protein